MYDEYIVILKINAHQSRTDQHLDRETLVIHHK